jgi:hypothetical protein
MPVPQVFVNPLAFPEKSVPVISRMPLEACRNSLGEGGGFEKGHER